MSSFRNLAQVCRINCFGWGCVVAATLSLSLCATQNATAQTLTYKTSWFGNSGGTQATHIMNGIDSLFVASNGTLYGATFWEEGGSNVLVFSPTDGSVICLPVQSGTGSWKRESNGVATGDGTYVYISMKQGNGDDGPVPNGFGGVRYPAVGQEWQTIRRYKLSDGYGATLTNGNGYDGSMLITSSGNENATKPVVGLAFFNNELYSVDSNTNTIRVYNATTMSATPVRSWAVTDPGKIQVDSAGFIWMLQPTNKKLVRYSNTGVLQSQSVTFAAAAVPLGFGIDTTQNRILVANDGVDQNILIYNNVLTAPGANGTFGTTGGIFFGTGAQIGLVGPRLFNRPTGVGADSSGNIYVACDASGSGGGTVIEKYDASGNRLWNKIGLEFVDGADTAPSSETDVYTKEEHFVMDYSQTVAGTEATYKGYTLNRFKYPNDPRLHDGGHPASPMIREMDGKRFLFVSNMYSDPPSIYRFNSATDGETAIPSGYFQDTSADTDWMPTRPGSGDWNWRDLNGNGNFDSNEFTQPSAPFTFGKWSVDTRGDIWVTSNDTVKTISKIPYGGLDSVGNPIYDYSARVSTTAPSIFTELCRIEYEPVTDTMWIAGFTTAKPNVGNNWGLVGSEIVRYDNWSAGNRTANLRIAIPYNSTSNPQIFSKSMALAGDYVFVVEVFDAQVHVYNRNTGVKAGIITPGPEVGSDSGWVDVDNGIRAKLRPNGEYLIFVEEDAFGKVLMYRWTPAVVTGPQPLTMGTIIGTTGSYDGISTRDKAFDGNTGTAFDGPTANGCWTGRDLGSGVTRRITQVKFYPRANLASRMTGGRFQGSKTGSSWTTLYTIPATPAENAWTSVSITNTTSWRYLRYLSPNASNGNVAEVEFYGQ